MDAPQVEFERKVVALPRGEGEDGELPEALRGIPKPMRTFWLTTKVVRWVAMLGAAVLIAWLTHRSGLSLDSALCVFIGLVPAIWIFGWLAGLALGLRATARSVRNVVRAVETTEGLPAPIERTQRVLLKVGDEALEITLRDAETSVDERWVWREVALDRNARDVFYLRRNLEVFEVARKAFADEAAFEAFAHAAQSRIWSALGRHPLN